MSSVEMSSESAAGAPPVNAGELRLAHGVEVSEVFHERTPGARFHEAGRESGPAPDRGTYGSFATFSDPDGNGWLLQEITTRLPGR
jgi:hypothetical protein